jgi:cytochrome c oxidase cbb3-type subunit III
LRLTHVMSAAAVFLTAVRLGAQQPPAAPPPPATPPAAAAPSSPAHDTPAPAHPPASDEDKPKYDPVSVERGQQLLVGQCGFCHGSNARGGQMGPDLTRSDLVQSDEGGKQLTAFLKVGRPEKKMPKFDLPDADVADLANFLHSTIDSVSNRGRYKILDIVTGDAKAGEVFFNGAGKCSACHSTTGDLKGFAARYEDPVALQGRFLMPRGGRRRRRGAPAPAHELPPFLEDSAIKATVTQATGEKTTGPLIRVTDFDVTIYDLATHQTRTWLRNGGSPTVELADPLQAHVDMLRHWTDTDIHNMTAFLTTLK